MGWSLDAVNANMIESLPSTLKCIVFDWDGVLNDEPVKMQVGGVHIVQREVR